jgi:hypothetical protein
MPKTEKTIRQPKEVSGEGYCRMCQKMLSSSKFYEATNPMIDISGLMSVCKEHCNEIYNEYFKIYNNMETALQYACRDLDVCFNQEVFRQTQSHVEKLLTQGKKAEAVFGYYKSKLGSTGKNNAGISSFRFKDSDVGESESKIILEDIDSDFITTEDIKKYWGRNLADWEYEYLENEMFKIKTSFECPDYGMEMLMRDICFINLDIEQVRQGEKGDVSKLIETRSKFMNDAKMKPIQATGAESNDQITFGTLIKKLENERPTDTPLDEWKDPDNFEKWHKVFVGHLAAMNDIENDTVKEYKEIIKPYTVERQEDGE